MARQRRINKVDERLAKELNTTWSFNKSRGLEERQAYANACSSMGLELYEGEHLLELIGITAPVQAAGYQNRLDEQPQDCMEERGTHENPCAYVADTTDPTAPTL